MTYNPINFIKLKHVFSVLILIALFGSTSSYASWCAIASSSRTQNQAVKVASKLGSAWSVTHTSNCLNMTPNLWIASVCTTSKAKAQRYAKAARNIGNIRSAYVKKCKRRPMSEEESYENGSTGTSPDYQ